jgi:hypothetical protein
MFPGQANATDLRRWILMADGHIKLPLRLTLPLWKVGLLRHVPARVSLKRFPTAGSTEIMRLSLMSAVSRRQLLIAIHQTGRIFHHRFPS